MPVKDRTDEFVKLRDMSGKAGKSPKKTAGDSKEIKGLHQKVNKINAKLKELSDVIDKVEVLQREVEGDPEQTRRNELKEAQLYVHKFGAQAATMIKEITPQEADSASDSLIRMQDNHFKSLTRRYVEQMNRFHRCQAEHSDKVRDLLVRQCEVKGDTDLDKIDVIMEQGQQQIFVDNLAMEVEDATRALDAVKVREKEILDLEKDVTVVRDMFVQVHALVHEQGETIDRIEGHVESTHNDLESGTKQLVQAKKSKAKARRCKIIVAVIIIIALAILAIVLAVEFA